MGVESVVDYCCDNYLLVCVVVFPIVVVARRPLTSYPLAAAIIVLGNYSMLSSARRWSSREKSVATLWPRPVCYYYY